jgi:hypothetical protein
MKSLHDFLHLPGRPLSHRLTLVSVPKHPDNVVSAPEAQSIQAAYGRNPPATTQTATQLLQSNTIEGIFICYSTPKFQ